MNVDRIDTNKRQVKGKFSETSRYPFPTQVRQFKGDCDHLNTTGWNLHSRSFVKNRTDRDLKRGDDTVRKGDGFQVTT